ncbi:MAG: hypothetical protein ACJ8C4_09645 [Gemmataceae bacterium]
MPGQQYGMTVAVFGMANVIAAGARSQCRPNEWSIAVTMWVIYQACVPGDPACSDNTAVCTEIEWKRMEAARPGRHRMLRGGIVSEGEAERLARQRVPELTSTASA